MREHLVPLLIRPVINGESGFRPRRINSHVARRHSVTVLQIALTLACALPKGGDLWRFTCMLPCDRGVDVLTSQQPRT